MTTAVIDFETRSVTNLETAGVSRYAHDPSTEVLCVGYCIGDGKPKIWTVGDPLPKDLFTADEFVAHNFPFERAIWTHILTPRHGWPTIPPLSKQRCTMTLALAAALPAARHDHEIETLTQRSISQILRHNPSNDVRQLLDLRAAGARASTKKFDALLASVDADNRLRQTLRFHASSTGRWSGRGYQPQNLKKPQTKDIDTAVAAILARDIARVRELGAPLTIAGDISRAVVCAAPGHRLMGGDFSSIEDRILAVIAGETWKVENYRKFDETGDPKFENYCVLASRALKREVTPEDEEGRGFGKVYGLAFNYGGGVGAWRKFDSSDTYTDAQIERFRDDFRRTHPATKKFWRRFASAAHRPSSTVGRFPSLTITSLGRW